MRILITICRYFIGILFIISGLIKANDPVGFSYKLKEYFDVFGWTFFSPMALSLSVFITVFEIACGVATLISYRMRLVTWLLMLMIVFFTFLTFYSAYFNKVTDCGCFGDALHLTPWQSFGKDLVLFVFILPLFILRNRIPGMLSEKISHPLMLLATLLSLWFNIYCINHLPVIDFRPYKIGTDIKKARAIPPGAPQDVFESRVVYLNKKTGEKKEFTAQELGKASYLWEDTATWKWDTTINKLISEGYKPPIHDFTISNPDGNDITDSILSTPGFTFLLVAYDINKSDKEVQPKVNALVAACDKARIPFVGLSASAGGVVDKFRHENQSMFPYYFVDETALKTMIRSNPGLILLNQGVVKAMWHYNDFPGAEEISKSYGVKF
ncbi:MAG: BT_3928 family protein [Bacteroidota bacterium]|jgi:uncharacterized membrane protein YphA (DoxX/SURF4 family)